MRKGVYTLLGVCALMLVVPGPLLAWNFDYEIYGSILETPVVYDSGGLTSGGDGVFEFDLDDAGWPASPWTSRFDSIWVNYFADNYDNTTPGAYKWVGRFTGRFYVMATNAPYGYNGWCEGTINATITVRDLNADGVLNYAEKWGDQLFDARLSKQCDDFGSGEMACTWGWGSLASNYFNFVIPPGIDTLYNGGNLTLLDNCPSANEQTSWGSIKALYR
jgi:hypothetical protein